MSIGTKKTILPTRPTLPTRLTESFKLLSIDSTISILGLSGKLSNSSITNLALIGITNDDTRLKIKDLELFKGDRSKFKIFLL